MPLEKLEQAAAVTYKLTGEHIKHALITNPGKIIVTRRQAGKTKAILGFIQERHPEGVVLFCQSVQMAELINSWLPAEYFLKMVLAYGPQRPPLFPGEQMALFADEFFWLPAGVQFSLMRDKRFQGAVSSPSHFADYVGQERSVILAGDYFPVERE